MVVNRLKSAGQTPAFTRVEFPAASKSKRAAFTLVELLVVIGIIAVLIAILLPALSRARDQANTVNCQANMRSWYQLMQLYTVDYKGSFLPARYTVDNAEYHWWSPALIGNELRKNDTTSGGSASSPDGRTKDEVTIAKYLYCPSAQHDMDVAALAANHGYYGDYTYNQNLGDMDLETTRTRPDIPFWKVTQVPGNVVVMTDICKAYGIANGVTPKNASIFSQMNVLLGNHSTPATPPAMWVPHAGKKKGNVLFADGHISTLAPREFVVKGTGGDIDTSTLPWTYKVNGAVLSTNTTLKTMDYLVGYFKNSVAPPTPMTIVTPWQRGQNGL